MHLGDSSARHLLPVLDTEFIIIVGVDGDDLVIDFLKKTQSMRIRGLCNKLVVMDLDGSKLSKNPQSYHKLRLTSAEPFRVTVSPPTSTWPVHSSGAT